VVVGKYTNSIIYNQDIIYVIDNKKDIVTFVTSALERNGYSVHSFTDSREALNDIVLNCSMNRKKVHMIITDIRMPEVNGFEIARRVRDINPDIPVVFMTAFEINSSEFHQVFPSLQVKEFLQKPFQIQKLIDTVKKYESAIATHR
jgi:DNA-binding NtrC family response regulator